MNKQCPISRGSSEYFSDESDIVSHGGLSTCYRGFNYCEVRLLKDMFQAFIQSFLELLQSIRLPTIALKTVKVTLRIQNAYFTIKQHLFILQFQILS